MLIPVLIALIGVACIGIWSRFGDALLALAHHLIGYRPLTFSTDGEPCPCTRNPFRHLAQRFGKSRGRRTDHHPEADRVQVKKRPTSDAQ